MSKGAQVYRYLFDGTRECLENGSSTTDAVDLARATANSPAAQIGLVDRVHVVGHDGYTVFDWQKEPDSWRPAQLPPQTAQLVLSLADAVGKSSVVSLHDTFAALVAVISAIGQCQADKTTAR